MGHDQHIKEWNILAQMATMNLAASIGSQDNINKVGHRKEKIMENGEEYNLLPIDRVTDISVRR